MRLEVYISTKAALIDVVDEYKREWKGNPLIYKIFPKLNEKANRDKIRLKESINKLNKFDKNVSDELLDGYKNSLQQLNDIIAKVMEGDLSIENLNNLADGVDKVDRYKNIEV